MSYLLRNSSESQKSTAPHSITLVYKTSTTYLSRCFRTFGILASMEKILKKKVIVYVISDYKLLVFRHVDFSYEEVGIQVPAGTIEPNESPEAAAIRELQEETGYSCFKILTKLGIQEYDMTPYRREIQERHFFLAEPTESLPERWVSNEGSINFECFWIPLESSHVLQSGQGSMIWKACDSL